MRASIKDRAGFRAGGGRRVFEEIPGNTAESDKLPGLVLSEVRISSKIVRKSDADSHFRILVNFESQFNFWRHVIPTCAYNKRFKVIISNNPLIKVMFASFGIYLNFIRYDF